MLFPIYRLKEMDRGALERVLRRSERDLSGIEARVREIIEEVREKGDDAITEFLSQQVGRRVRREELRVGGEQISQAYKSLDESLINAIKTMIRNVRRFHEAQMPKSFLIEVDEGVYAGQEVVPLGSAGLYVPSGKATYPSVSVMVTVPAKVAGVGRIAVASPPHGNDMRMDPATLVAAHMAGANEFYIVGGAHAIAAFAYGTETIRPVDVVAGPGGPWTYCAKKLVRDVVRTDAPAGPSESAVIADGSVDPAIVAWDVLNEAEHGPDSASVLVTLSTEYAERVARELEKAVEKLPEPRASFVKSNAGRYSVIIVCDSLEEAVEFVNEYAPEHLLIDSTRAREIYERFKKKLRNFGTLCLNTPISAGNYGLGPNATLPTGGYARLYSGLSVDTFIKKPTIEIAEGAGLRRLRDVILRLADYEGFPSHAEAVKARTGDS